VQFAVKLLDTVDVPVYQRIASMALQLKRLGLSMARVARTLDVSDKTAAKAIKWLEVHNPIGETETPSTSSGEVSNLGDASFKKRIAARRRAIQTMLGIQIRVIISRLKSRCSGRWSRTSIRKPR
jgi:CTP-dependent riboflavin kinase